MDAEQKKLAYFLAALAIVALVLHFLYAKMQAQNTAAVTPPDNDDFYAPYYYPSPGNYPAVQPFESTVNVYADNPLLGTLAYQYIPIFGLVGIQSVS